MRVINFIIEILFSPFSLILKSNSVDTHISKYSKPIAVFIVSLLIVAVLILFYYREIIF